MAHTRTSRTSTISRWVSIGRDGFVPIARCASMSRRRARRSPVSNSRRLGSRTRCAIGIVLAVAFARASARDHPGRARARLSHGRRGDFLSRYVRRAALQARLSATDRGGAPARESRGGPPASRAMAARHAFARSDVRQRHHRHRSSADRGGYRAGTQAHVRISEARLVRRTGLAENQAGGAAACATHRAGCHLGQGRRRHWHPPVPM